MSVMDEDLRLLDLALRRSTPPFGLEDRILHRIDGVAKPRRRVPALLAGLLGLAAGIAAVALLRPEADRQFVIVPTVVTPDASEPAPSLAEAIAFDDGCEHTRTDDRLELAEHCRIRIDRPRMMLDTWADTALRLTPHGVALERGTVLFDVDPVRGDDPVRVEVPDGEIEVVGTRFVVSARADGGHIDLLEGKIRFHHDDVVLDVEPGRRYAWGSSVADVPGSTEQPKPPRVEAPLPDLARGLGEVARLRQQGKHAEAVARLHALGRGVRDRHAREVLSFEEGTLLEKFEPAAVVCEHWERHRRRFGAGSYTAEIGQRRQALDCE
jgi:hypothetical protein